MSDIGHDRQHVAARLVLSPTGEVPNSPIGRLTRSELNCTSHGAAKVGRCLS